MAKISSSTIDEVNQRTDFVSLVSEYASLEKRGNEYWAKCPFHTDKTPSFHIIPEKGMYKCFSCGRGGSVINFFMEMEKLSFPEAVLQLAKRSGIEVVYEGNADFVKEENVNRRDEYVGLYNRLADTYRYFLTETEMGKFAQDYLDSRGISQEMAERFKIGYSPADGKWLKSFLKKKNYTDDFLAQTGLFSKKYPDFAFFRDRLMFPIFDRRGDVVAFSARFLRGDPEKTGKYVNTPETAHYKKGETLFGFNFAKNEIRLSKKVVICEGNFDVIAYHQAGIGNAVASCGTALTENHIKMLSSFVDTVYLSFDSDNAGIDATIKAIMMCRSNELSVRIVKLEGGKDPAEILNNFGKESLQNAINNAVIDADFLLSVLAKRYDVATLDGKRLASYEFFKYIRVLKSDIQKEACLNQLCQTYNLNPEAVRRDFSSQSSITTEKKYIVPEKEGTAKKMKTPVKINAEIRAVLAVVSRMENFSKMRSVLSVDDFEDPLARDMFIALEECFREGSTSFDSFLSRCTDERVRELVVNSVTKGEFQENYDKVFQDCINLIKRNSLKRRRDHLQNQVCKFSQSTLEEKKNLEFLLSEIMGLDAELKKYT
ncbi:MAG: DNA primase [Spirochaetales bacterium]|nr:DNA primase [Spirochaetales bacterium]